VELLLLLLLLVYLELPPWQRSGLGK